MQTQQTGSSLHKSKYKVNPGGKGKKIFGDFNHDCNISSKSVLRTERHRPCF